MLRRLMGMVALLAPLMLTQQITVPLEDKDFWYKEGRTSLGVSLGRRQNVNVARNVIIFVGDGMGLPTVTAARIFREQQRGHPGEEGFLSFDTFPDVGLVKTYNVDKQVPDSAATGTAMFSGVKTNYYTLGVDATARWNVCDATVMEHAAVSSLMTWAQDAGKDTGIVTTTRITHATPAALYAHVTERYWECDTSIPEQYRTCTKDIARQLVEDAPGKNFKVVLGGGLQQLGVSNSSSETSCRRGDGRDLTLAWLADKKARGKDATFVRTSEQLAALRPGQQDFVMGIFAHGHMDYDVERNRAPEGSPSLVNMTIKAIELLQEAQNGYVLMVEGGLIDHAHHRNYARVSLLETVQFDAAVSAALERTSRQDTLIVVTADHSHAMTINGYPERGNDILGFAHKTEGKMKYETLTYANGPSFSYHRKKGVLTESDYLWRDVTQDQTRQENRYRHFAPIQESWATHTGEDVAVYAIGPFSHLFNGVHEQSYIAHAISCAGRFGPDADMCISAASSHHSRALAPLTAAALLLRIFVY